MQHINQHKTYIFMYIVQYLLKTATSLAASSRVHFHCFHFFEKLPVLSHFHSLASRIRNIWTTWSISPDFTKKHIFPPWIPYQFVSSSSVFKSSVHFSGSKKSLEIKLGKIWKRILFIIHGFRVICLVLM